ncbi:potassium channel toxin gamma-KTx 1.1-like [Centruroides sculpturatus]|uniref:potassium channel toxin gamma-KTx 1.1-like n=1 Tax=Centruroides sculpturatus TaxID=218467 RepID=UPI000C6E82D2|nr:potassium channel toxin gamma-KTx 1.1-like [Centruroides sculpturatus]
MFFIVILTEGSVVFRVILVYKTILYSTSIDCYFNTKMKNILLMMLIFSAFILNGVESAKDSCRHLKRCGKYGFYKNCSECCREFGHEGGYCTMFKCKCKT